MNYKILALALVALVIVVTVSGCVSTPSGTTDTGGEDQVTPEEESQALDDIESELISEEDTVDIGEMI